MNSFGAFKQLRVTLILAGTNQVFPGTNSNTLILTGLRVMSRTRVVARLAATTELKIFGMAPQDMNALTVAWANPPVVLDHLVILEANDGNGWVQIFKGTIIEAQPQYSAQPDVYFELLARTGYAATINVAEATPYTYPGSVAADIAINDLITRMGFTAVIAGEVGAVTLTNPYWSGTPWDQLRAACQAAGADFYTLGDTILVTPSGQPRQDRPAVVLNPQSGLIGYPTYARDGLNVDAIFNPAFSCGVPLDIASSVPNATGRWYPYCVTHELDARLPNGQWRSKMKCLRVIV